MSRTSIGLVLIAVVGVLSPNATRAGDSAVEAKRAVEVRKKLDATIDFSGIEDPDTKVGEVLQLILGRNGIKYEFNEQAFRDEQLDDLASKPLGREIPKESNVPIATILRRILARIPTPSGTTFAVRGGVVEITTRRFASPSSWQRYREWQSEGRYEGNPIFPPVVTIAFDKRDLQDALQEIADATSVNIVLDARSKEKGKTPITATLRDAAVDTVVQLLADMADLEAVTVDDILYVTTKENAKKQRQAQEKARMKLAEDPKPAQTEPGPKMD
jgi:hypothetical protein